MDEFVYQSVTSYFNTLSKLGYASKQKVNSLLVLLFYYNLMYHDYRGYISGEDYHSIEKALNCLYGSNCLIPYPDYLKMGKLRLGEITELAQRTKNLEAYSGELDQRILDNDTLIEDSIKRIDEHGTRLDHHDYLLGKHKERLDKHAGEIAVHEERLNDHVSRIDTLEKTRVMQKKNAIQTVPEIDLTTWDVITGEYEADA